MLEGSLPLSLSNVARLEVLDISHNSNIYGVIPPEIGSLSKLTYLNLSHNHLGDQFPLSFTNLIELLVLDISNNSNIHGVIPPEIGSLSKLTHLNLSHNEIGGELPLSLSNLTKLEVLDISHNNFISGAIPPRIGYLQHLVVLDLAFNDLEGRIPLSVFIKFPTEVFLNNSKLLTPEGTAIMNDTAKHHYSGIIIPVVILCGGIFLVSIGQVSKFILSRKGKKAASNAPDPKHGNIFKIWNYDGNIAYQDIIGATEDFDIRYCIGTGGYGSVYRSQLPTGTVVAVKKLHRFEGENPNYDMCFRNEAEVLSQIRHRHIVKLFGYCLHQRSMFLIYDYMERGSLFSVLKYDDEAAELNWVRRVNVVKGIANALSYMHHDCSPPILHRDISSSNILLNSKFEGYVSDLEQQDCWIQIHPIRLYLWELMAILHLNWPLPWW